MKRRKESKLLLHFNADQNTQKDFFSCFLEWWAFRSDVSTRRCDLTWSIQLADERERHNRQYATKLDHRQPNVRNQNQKFEIYFP